MELGRPLTAPIFTGGAIRGQVRSAEAVQQQALLRYQQSIQASFREVEDALIDQTKSRERLEVQTRLLESLRSYVRLARLRFDNGYTSYIEVLDAERRLFAAELLQAETKGALFSGAGEPLQGNGRRRVLEADRLTDTTTESKKSKPDFLRCCMQINNRVKQILTMGGVILGLITSGCGSQHAAPPPATPRLPL